MSRLHNFTTITILTYSVILVILGVFLIVFGHYHLNTFLKFVFAEMVDIKVWRLNWYILGFLYISGGAVGAYFGVLIRKKREGIERLWLLLVSWQFIISFIHVGPYRIGEPDLLSITIIGCICFWSWFAFFPSEIKKFSLTNKNFAFELILFFTIATQLFAITYINNKEDPSLTALSNLSEQEFENKINDELLGNAIQNNVFTDMYGRYHEKYFKFYDYYEQKDVEKLRNSGKFLLNNGYANDRFILGALATDSYARGELQVAASQFKLAIEGGYPTDLAKPSGKLIYFEEAQLHYMLYLVYEELGNSPEAEKELAHALSLFQKFYGTKYSEELLKKGMDMSREALVYLKK